MTELEKLDAGLGMIRKATDKDIASIAVIYDLVLKQEEDGLATIGWQRGVYPTEEVARQAVLRGDMYVLEDEKTHDISATAIINHIQDSANKEGKWSIEADGNEVLALHTLVVNPQESGKGLGTAFVAFYEQMAKEIGCKTLRMNTGVQDSGARAFYHKLGYAEIGIVSCEFNDMGRIELVLIEKLL